MDKWHHWWTIAQWCQSGPDHLRLRWSNADIPVIVDLIIEILLQYEDEKSDVKTDRLHSYFLVFDCGSDPETQSGTELHSCSVTQHWLFRGLSTWPYRTVARTTWPSLSFHSLPPATAQVWVKISIYTTVVLPLQAHVQPNKPHARTCFFFVLVTKLPNFMWDFHFFFFFLLSPVIMDHPTTLDVSL